MRLFGIDLELPPYKGEASVAQLVALGNMLEKRGVVSTYGIRALCAEAGFEDPPTKAQASLLIDWCKQAADKDYSALAHRAAEQLGQGRLI